jgi:hypothetical protein
MGKIATDDAMLILVEQILRSESDFKNVHREDGRLYIGYLSLNG